MSKKIETPENNNTSHTEYSYNTNNNIMISKNPLTDHLMKPKIISKNQ